MLLSLCHVLCMPGVFQPLFLGEKVKLLGGVSGREPGGGMS